MIPTAEGFPPSHYRDGRRVMNSRDLSKYFGRPPNQMNTSIQKRLMEGDIQASDILTVKAQGLHRFDSFDLAMPAVAGIVSKLRRPGDEARASRLLHHIRDELPKADPKPAAIDPLDMIAFRNGVTPVVNSDRLSTYHGCAKTVILSTLNRAIRADNDLRADIWEVNVPRTQIRSLDMGVSAYTAFSKIFVEEFRAETYRIQALLVAFAEAAQQRPSEAKIAATELPTQSEAESVPASIVETDDNGHLVINSHTLAKLLDERHRVVRNAITEIAAHNMYFARAVRKTQPRGELTGNTFNLDRDAAVAVLNKFGPTKRERAMAPMLAAFDGIVSLPPVPAEDSYQAVLDQVPTPEITVMSENTLTRTLPDEGDDDISLPARSAEQPIVFDRGGTLLATSRDVAAFFGKKHFHVMRDIDNIIAQAADTPQPEIIKSCFNIVNSPHPENPGRLLRYVEMDERGLLILVGRFSGAKALEKQFAYAEEFRRMRELLGGSLNGTVSIDEIVKNPTSFIKLFAAYADLALQVSLGDPRPRARLLDAHKVQRRYPYSRAHDPASAEQDMSLSVAGHMLDMRARQFTQALRNRGILTADNQPTPEGIRLGLFHTKVGTGYHGKKYSQTKVTPSGLRYLQSIAHELAPRDVQG